MTFQSEEPLTMMVNAGLEALPYAEILLEYAQKLEENELNMVVRAMSEKGFNIAAPFLLSLFENPRNTDLWAVGNALCLINDKNSLLM